MNDPKLPLKQPRKKKYHRHLNPQTAEILLKIQDEALEVATAINKILHHGPMSYDPTSTTAITNLDQLQLELGELLAWVKIARGHDLVFLSPTRKAQFDKLRSLPMYTHHQSKLTEEEVETIYKRKL